MIWGEGGFNTPAPPLWNMNSWAQTDRRAAGRGWHRGTPGLGGGCRGPWEGCWMLWGPEVTGRDSGRGRGLLDTLG